MLTAEDKRRLLSMGIGKGILPEDIHDRYLGKNSLPVPIVQHE